MIWMWMKLPFAKLLLQRPRPKHPLVGRPRRSSYVLHYHTTTQVDCPQFLDDEAEADEDEIEDSEEEVVQKPKKRAAPVKKAAVPKKAPAKKAAPNRATQSQLA